MNLRSAVVVSTSAAVLAVTLFSAGPSSAGVYTSPLAHRPAVRLAPIPPVEKDVCYSNLVTMSQVGIVSQNFGPGVNGLDAQGADDFNLPTRCRVSTIGIDGRVYNGVADTFDVTFYKNKGGRPGRVVSATTSNTVGACPSGVACDTAITLPRPVTLKKGVGWVSVQANLDLGSGEFVWVTGLTQNGQPAVWENPGDGWGRGCTTWNHLDACWGDQHPGRDFEFVLLK